MPERTVDITAPSRLHFGMLSFGNSAERQFGGAGVMIDKPGLHVRIEPADRLDASGPLADRALAFALRAAKQLGVGDACCRVCVLSAPTEHTGLGTGTQLGLAVAAGLCRFFNLDEFTPQRLALLSGRGERSAIGTYGFCNGGLLVEAGKLPGESLSPLVSRAELPSPWRFVLVAPREQSGLYGDAERAAFAGLAPVPLETTAELSRELLMHLLPSAATGDFADFSESLYRYGHRAGMCFAANQGGPFASPQLASLVADMRAAGVRGVGQSSWGPTLFALVSNAHAAQALVDDFAAISKVPVDLTIAAPNSCGAQIKLLES